MESHQSARRLLAVEWSPTTAAQEPCWAQRLAPGSHSSPRPRATLRSPIACISPLAVTPSQQIHASGSCRRCAFARPSTGAMLLHVQHKRAHQLTLMLVQWVHLVCMCARACCVNKELACRGSPAMLTLLPPHFHHTYFHHTRCTHCAQHV